MDNKIRKRSGHLVTFDINKIYKAIDSAFESCGRKCPATFRTIINQNQNKFKALGTVERIQDELENLLLTCGYVDIYKHFTTYRAERAEQRERLKRKDLMSIVNVEVNDITTDNANMAAQTPAGMMMKFAGELSKPFANQELIAPEFVKASDDNYIYIHDKDYFPTKSMTCVFEGSYITIRDGNGDEHHTQMKYLDKFLDGYVDGSGMVPLKANMWIQGRNGWTKIIAVSRRSLAPGEPLYSFNTHKGLPLKVTGNHQVPVIRDEHEVLLLAEDIKVGDVLLSPVVFDHTLIDGGYENAVYDYVKIESIDKTTSDAIKVYDIETGEHWFVTNDYVVHNCVQTPLDKLLRGGLFAGHGEIRPAKRIETAVVVAVISLQTTQNEMHGGQAIPAFDFYMAPYVHLTYLEEVEKLGETLEWTPEQLEYYKGLDIKEYTEEGQVDKYARIAVKRTINRTHQAMESFIHNCNNIHSRGGNQVVFSSINYGTDTSPEGRLVIRELLNCTLDGVGNGATAIFPIHVFKCKAGVNKNPGDPNYDLYKLSWPVTARRFFPNYLNLDASFNQDPNWKADDPRRFEHEVATMGCRTRTYSNRYGQSTSIGRGNLSFTSINLPKLAIEVAIETGFYVPTEGGYKINPDCKVPLATRIKMFKSRLRSTADLVAKQLDDRYKFQKQALKNQFPLLMSGVWFDSEKLKSGQTVESVIKHGTLGVSFIGLAETLIMLTGKHHGESDGAQAVGLDIISYLSSLCDGYSDEYDHNYSCFATPAEGLSGRFVVVDRKVYGNIEHVTDKDYYTNSSHVPVWYQCTPQHKAEIEGPYHKYEPGGHIFYVEADADITKNPEYVDAINRMAWANDCGYSSINHTQGRCEDCNFESNDPDLHRFGSTCPHCGGHWSTLDRVTGYLSSTYNKQAFGKKAEILDRVVHTH